MQVSAWIRLAAAWALAPVVLAVHGQGTTVAIGGALRDDNAAVWSRLVGLAGGPGACFSVFATASSQPDATAAGIGANLARHGARSQHIRVAPRIAGLDVAQAVRDPVWVAQVLGCRGVFFSGGAQERLLDSLQPGGHGTPLLDAVRTVWRSGGVVAGTSSGAAVLSALAFRDAPDPLAVMRGSLRAGHEWDRGFGFVPADVIVDQHFIRRGRIARLLPLMQAQGVALGVGVEEDSAAVFGADGMVEVLGTHGVLVADLTNATRNTALAPFNVQGATVHWLQLGDRFDLAERRVQAATTGQVLPGHAVVQSMSSLLDTARTRSAGPTGRESDLQFEWHLWRDAATAGWTNPATGPGTLTGVRLDIVPTRLPHPRHDPNPAPRTPPP